MKSRTGCWRCRIVALAVGVCFVVGCAMLKKYEQPIRDLLHCPKTEQPADPLPVYPDGNKPDDTKTEAAPPADEPDQNNDDPNWESRGDK